MPLRPALPALTAALLFGASTPLAKVLVGAMPPMLLAGLLYLGCGVGLGALLLLRLGREPGAREALRVSTQDAPGLLGSVIFGGVIGPALLMAGLARADAATVALLLNVEGALTAVIAWLVFRENADRHVVLGMLAIVAGGCLLSWEPGGATGSSGVALVVGACLAWAIDNNLTRRISTHDAMLIACIKGLAAGACNTSLALLAGATMPAPAVVGASALVGFLGYGLSLALFVVGLRTLGTARTGAYFSVAPLFGVLVSLMLWPQWPSMTFWLAGALMGLGVWLHLRERHEHEHTHEALDHAHPHRHDEHHRHVHPFPWDGTEPHVHPHRHAVLTHRHPHHPDVHHRHDHGR